MGFIAGNLHLIAGSHVESSVHKTLVIVENDIFGQISFPVRYMLYVRIEAYTNVSFVGNRVEKFIYVYYHGLAPLFKSAKCSRTV
jgi:hypothetical protein